MIDLICIDCSEPSIGICENCGAAICADHDSAEFIDVETCRDKVVCAARVRENKLVDSKLSAV